LVRNRQINTNAMRAKLQVVGLMAIALLLVASHGQALAANRCVGPDGQVSFQDTPCPSNSKTAAPIRLRENTVSNGLGRQAAPEKLVFGPSRYENLMTAAGAMEVLATNGRDCRLELKVRPDSDDAITSCNRYLAQYRMWREPAAKEIREAIKDEAWNQANRDIIRKASESAGIVNEVHAFITLNLRNR
jgi:Domain of unknown function (DUF4124)